MVRWLPSIVGCECRSLVHGRIVLLWSSHSQKLRLLDQRLFLILISHTSHQHARMLIELHGHAEYFLLLCELWFGMEVAHDGRVGLVNFLKTILHVSELLWAASTLCGVICWFSILARNNRLHLNWWDGALMALILFIIRPEQHVVVAYLPKAFRVSIIIQ